MTRYAPAATAAALFALALAVQPAMTRGARVFPPLSAAPSTPYALQDAALASAGLRAAAADLAWIQLLQYAAGSLPEIVDAPDRPYGHLKELSLRVVSLDPSFHRAYLFGAGILAFFHEVERVDDAVDILREGMRRDPGQPLYSVYLAAIAYKRRGDSDRLLAVLESTIGDPKSPIEMKAIVANLYKSRGEYAKALAIWNAMLDNPDESREWPRARIQVAEIQKLLKSRRARP